MQTWPETSLADRELAEFLMALKVIMVSVPEKIKGFNYSVGEVVLIS